MQNTNTLDWFEIFKACAEILLSLVAIGISIKAIRQTKKQIELSNKQQLMNRRLENYILAYGLIENFGVVKKSIDLTDLEKTLEQTIRNAVFRTDLLDMRMFSIPGDMDSYLNDINNKLTNMRESAKEITIIFNTQDAEPVSSFLENLSSFLLCGITCSIYFKAPKDKQKAIESDINKAKKELINAYNITEAQYDLIIEKNAVENLLKQIKL